MLKINVKKNIGIIIIAIVFLLIAGYLIYYFFDKKKTVDEYKTNENSLTAVSSVNYC